MVVTVAPVRRTIFPMTQTDAANDARRDIGNATRRRMLAELARREAAREIAPTWGDLGDALGILGTSAHYHGRILRAAGLVTFLDGRARTIALTDAGRAQVA